MGIKHFFSWFRQHDDFKHTISKNVPTKIDHILIDMNGIIHNCSQQIYQYGKYQPKCPQIILKKHVGVPTLAVKSNAAVDTSTIHKVCIDDDKEQKLFALIKKTVNELIEMCNPQKTVFLAIDGVAPQGKQNQQRQRRFRAAKENALQIYNFDSNCITAGTDFMQRLATNLEQLDWICKKNLNITFSSDNIPGEGEHKLIDWIRSYDVSDAKTEVYTVVGMDADLILLCMCLHKQNVFILRENEKEQFDWIDIAATRSILGVLDVTPEDLVVWACFIGNDFLPPIPSLEIKESFPETGALDYFLLIKKKSLINVKTKCFNIIEIKRILSLIALRENEIMIARSYNEDKNPKTKSYYTRYPNKLWNGNISDYRDKYFQKLVLNSSQNKSVITKQSVAHDYMKTVYWVFLYYTVGIPDWDWFYPHSYALHAFDMVHSMPNVIMYKFNHNSKPSHFFEQLLRVIPTESKKVIPECLWSELERINKDSIFKIDFEGKRQMWEAITIVNFVYPNMQNIIIHEGDANIAPIKQK